MRLVRATRADPGDEPDDGRRHHLARARSAALTRTAARAESFAGHVHLEELTCTDPRCSSSPLSWRQPAADPGHRRAPSRRHRSGHACSGGDVARLGAAVRARTDELRRQVARPPRRCAGQAVARHPRRVAGDGAGGGARARAGAVGRAIAPRRAHCRVPELMGRCLFVSFPVGGFFERIRPFGSLWGTMRLVRATRSDPGDEPDHTCGSPTSPCARPIRRRSPRARGCSGREFCRVTFISRS